MLRRTRQSVIRSQVSLHAGRAIQKVQPGQEAESSSSGFFVAPASCRLIACQRPSSLFGDPFHEPAISRLEAGATRRRPSRGISLTVTFASPCHSLTDVDQAWFVWYHHPIQDSGYCLWRGLPRAASSERRCRDALKCTPRNIATQHEGMELHGGIPESIDAEQSSRVLRRSITENASSFHPP